MREGDLVAIALVFAPLSLAAFGSGTSVLSEMQHQTVEVQGWMTSGQFLNLFAIARAAPGPGSMITTLIGWHVAGWAGAFVATAAMFVPSSILCATLVFFWRRHRDRPVIIILERSLIPIGVGFLLAALITLTGIVSRTPVAAGIAVVSAVITLLRPSIHPLVLLAAGAGLNVLFYLTG